MCQEALVNSGEKKKKTLPGSEWAAVCPEFKEILHPKPKLLHDLTNIHRNNRTKGFLLEHSTAAVISVAGQCLILFI